MNNAVLIIEVGVQSKRGVTVRMTRRGTGGTMRDSLRAFRSILWLGRVSRVAAHTGLSSYVPKHS